MTDAVGDFTADPLLWRPYLDPVVLADATPAQHAALQETPSNTAISAYVLTLAHDAESLSQRTPLFNGIMYGRGGLSRAERELAATAASVVNRCIYCASVHAGRYIALTKQPAVIDAVFREDDADLDARAQAVIGFARKLAETPPAAMPSDLQALRDAGLAEVEILDLILSVALFGWANRLMHTLGEPIRPDAPGALA